MAMSGYGGHDPITSFEQWYNEYDVDSRTGCLEFRNVSPQGDKLWHRFQVHKREMDRRVERYGILEQLADGEVISPKPDLPNVSSGETAGLVRRIARALVRQAPNVEVISKFNDDDKYGILSKYVLTSKIIGSDQYSNDMQQSLFASTKTAFTLGFDAVIPVLLQDAAKGWYVKYDSIHYRDVFPEPGAKDIRTATDVFVRRYLTEGEVRQLISNNVVGWDPNALRRLLKNRPPSREQQSVDHQTKKHHQIPDGYPIITWYSSTGDPFLTFSENEKTLLRIEKNKHPLKQHPVHFLVLEKDDQQPLGKSQVELLIGRQDFQDLMLNGAMKLWYRNINPSIIGYGTVNSIPNLSPGKYTQISNPNAKIEAFEVNTQTLLQYGAISRDNLGSMVNLVGAPDQQMQQSAGGGMSATPQGVEAQSETVDITTNNYQKAIEGFFSHYCSYALTMYFAELAAVKGITPTAEARIALRRAGATDEMFKEDGSIECDFAELATEYWVRCIPGSLVELEDEKQMRILNNLFVPLSQAMPAVAASQDQDAIRNMSKAMQYIVAKQIELSGSIHAKDIGMVLEGRPDEVSQRDARIQAAEDQLVAIGAQQEAESDLLQQAVLQMQEQISLLVQNQSELLKKIGAYSEPPTTTPNTSEEGGLRSVPDSQTVIPASA